MRKSSLLIVGVGLLVAACANGGGDIVGGGAGGSGSDDGGGGEGGNPTTNTVGGNANGGNGGNGGNPNTTTNNMNTTTSPDTTTTMNGTGCTGQFDCGNGQCVPLAQECDQTVHCANGADETPINPNCASGQSSTGPGGGGCDPLMFEIACNDGSCIFFLALCDGFTDCPDGSDEEGCGGGTVPAEWTCDETFYDAGDGCDCGCGAVDPDCTDATSASCDYCNETGSCSTGAAIDDCPAMIDPNDNSTCI